MGWPALTLVVGLCQGVAGGGCCSAREEEPGAAVP